MFTPSSLPWGLIRPPNLSKFSSGLPTYQPRLEDSFQVFSVSSTLPSKPIPRYFPSPLRLPRLIALDSQTWFPPAASKMAAMASLEKSSLEWTAIYNGHFLDYWGMPKVKSYLNPVTMFLDIGAAKAGIPGSGTTPAVFTYSGDVARFTAAALTLEKWEKESYVIGTKICWNDFVKVAEDVRGTC